MIFKFIFIFEAYIYFLGQTLHALTKALVSGAAAGRDCERLEQESSLSRHISIRFCFQESTISSLKHYIFYKYISCNACNMTFSSSTIAKGVLKMLHQDSTR